MPLLFPGLRDEVLFGSELVVSVRNKGPSVVHMDMNSRVLSTVEITCHESHGHGLEREERVVDGSVQGICSTF